MSYRLERGCSEWRRGTAAASRTHLESIGERQGEIKVEEEEQPWHGIVGRGGGSDVVDGPLQLLVRNGLAAEHGLRQMVYSQDLRDPTRTSLYDL